MTKTRLFSSLVLIAVFLAACASGTPTAPPAQPEAAQPGDTGVPVAATATPAVDLTATFLVELNSATPPSDAQPVATSRGPDLHATDPSTVRLASGGLQLVEFFRFT